MIKDLIDELKAIDEKLVPIGVGFYDMQYHCKYVKLNYSNSYYGLNVRIYKDKAFYIYYGLGKAEVMLFSNKCNCDFGLVMLLYNNKDKITEIVLKYL